ncbi:alpha/beta hydrolase family protein [Nocardioides acrostichi]|uniref:Alpha/beta hydrolase family protein n=1 Tax=Nocardioides acrostichi TaxID=2784339 RepID=A0A930UZ26_9ACTN|nr:hypothetical protein [Nocardioides acrostichi]MBF4163533.1 hypothetical protein [Nocardioides acrostichi]
MSRADAGGGARASAAPVVSVVGGVAGVSASWAGAESLAGTFDQLGELAERQAAAVREARATPAFAASRTWCPPTHSLAVLALVSAGESLGRVAESAPSAATSVRRAVGLLRAADEAAHLLLHSLLGALVLLPSAAGVLGGLYPATPVRVVPRGDLLAGASGRAPSSIYDLLEHLGQLSALSPGDSPDNGTIEVQSFTGPDGVVRHIVYLPGTDDMTTLPWTADDDVRDLGANLDLVGEQPDRYTQGVLDVLAQIGVQPGEPVLMVGHSQGGMVAAGALAHGSPYHVSHVVTFGAPVGQLGGLPAGSHVLSLENAGDVVPHLEGSANADSPQHTTVTFAGGTGGHPVTGFGSQVLGHHSYEAYAHGAAAVDDSGDPSVAEQVSSLHAAGFLGHQGPVEHQVWQVLGG